MGTKRTVGEKELDARRNEAAREAVAAHARARSATENLEEALRLHEQATEFARAFADGRRRARV